MVAQRAEHARQAVRADVRARVSLDLFRRAEADQIGDHRGDAGAIFGPRVELAVGVGPRAPLAEAVVRARHQLTARDQRQVPAARLHGLAHLEDGRRNARLAETQRRPGPGRARADDHHPRRRPAGRPAALRARRRRGQERLSATRDRDAQALSQRPPFARVERAPHDAQLTGASRAPSERPFDLRGEWLVEITERNKQIDRFSHRPSCFVHRAVADAQVALTESPTRRRASRQWRPPLANSRQGFGRLS